jgi:gluconate 2-dehydrogenase gamma chain
MPSYSTDRRGLLKIIGAIGATCTHPFSGDELFGRTADQHAHEETANTQPKASLTFFRDDDFKTISQISELIIPRTNTPGAIDAGVPYYIDRLIAGNIAHQQQIADGLRWLDEQSKQLAGKEFLSLSEDQQLSILDALCKSADSGDFTARSTQFFWLIKNLTADGYYTSQAGLMEELGYKGNTVHTAFPDCEHEH